MSRETTVEDMLAAQCVFYGECENCPVFGSDENPQENCRIACEKLYNADYRKRGEVAIEVIQEIANFCTDPKSPCDDARYAIGYLSAMNTVLSKLLELKKKYKEGH
jgi:hypothetical protein